MKVDYKKWIDPDGQDGDYLGWGYQANIGKVHLGWFPAYKDGFQFSISTVSFHEYDGMKKDRTLEECKELLQQLLTN